MLPQTTKRRITTNLKTINNQKCQKIKLHGTPTITELKKTFNQTSRKKPGSWVDCVGRGWLREPMARQRTMQTTQVGLAKWETET